METERDGDAERQGRRGEREGSRLQAPGVPQLLSLHQYLPTKGSFPDSSSDSGVPSAPFSVQEIVPLSSEGS